MSAHKPNRIAKILMPLSLGTVGVAGLVGFIAPDAFAPDAQAAVYISILLGAVALALSYIMRMKASKRLEIDDMARLRPSAAQSLTTPCENFVHECCLTGMHRL